jgi:hypothetical protein
MPATGPIPNPCQKLGQDLARLTRADQLPGWLDQQKQLASNVKHNLKVSSDFLLLSKLPEVKADQIQQRIHKLDSILDRMDKLIKLVPDESTLTRVIEQLTRSQTTIALLMGLFVGWLSTYSWHKPRQNRLSTHRNRNMRVLV